MKKIDARKLPPEALKHIRRQAFVLRRQAYTWAHIAEGVGVMSVPLWLHGTLSGQFGCRE